MSSKITPRVIQMALTPIANDKWRPLVVCATTVPHVSCRTDAQKARWSSLCRLSRHIHCLRLYGPFSRVCTPSATVAIGYDRNEFSTVYKCQTCSTCA